MIWRLAKDLDLPAFWPYGRLKSSKIENEALKNNILSSLRPMDENLRQHEQSFQVPKIEIYIKKFSDKIFQKLPLWTARETREPCARSALYTAALSMQCDQLVARGVFFQNETSLKITTHIEGGWVVLKMVAIFLLSESYIWWNTNAYCYGIEAGTYVH